MASEYSESGIYTPEKLVSKAYEQPNSLRSTEEAFYVPIGVDIIGETGEENLIDQIKIKLDQK